MIVVRGVGASKGIAIGQARLLGDTFVEALCVRIEDTDAEIKRLMQAHNTALTDLEQLYQKMNTTMDKDHAMIIKAHILLLKEDSTYISEIKSGIIGMKVNAEYAVKLASDKIRKQFGEMENEYMRERAADIKDISMRLTRLLMGQPVQWSSNRYRQEVLITNDLLPSETVDLDLNSVAAILCKEGSSMSHSSILARTMNIPSVVGLEKQLDSIEDGDELLIDGTTGTVYINPDKETFEQYDRKREELFRDANRLKSLIGKPAITLDGRSIPVRANGSVVGDLTRIIESDAEGIGLFRSEFLYMRSDCLPSEEEQFEHYKKILQSMKGKPVTIRTLDVGSDKEGNYLHIPPEKNPAMGFRGMRLGLWYRDVYKTQIKALYRASAYGNLSIMFPMISTLDEVEQGKRIIEEVKSELRHERIPFADHIPLGIMIETPASALISDILAKYVDYFSVGTNDLAQYILAADRMNSRLSYLYENVHLAVLRLIKFTADNIHREGKKVSVCGELAADKSMTPLLLSVGVDELSVNPSSVLEIRETVRNIDISLVRDTYLNSIK